RVGRDHARRPPRAPCPVPPRSRPAMDRPHHGAAGGLGGGDPVMNGMSIPSELPEPRRVIEARDVVLSFGETPALRGANMSAAQGEILAVMGPSGSGKSTLLYCLAGISVPASGEIWYDGGRLDTLAEPQRSRLRRAHFGFVFQFGQLVPELTAEENVALPLLC